MNFNYLHLLSYYGDYLIIDNRPNLIIYNVKNKSIKVLKTNISWAHSGLTGILPVDSSFTQIIGAYVSSTFDGNHQTAFGVFDFNKQKLTKKFFFEGSNFITKSNDSTLKFRYSDHLSLQFFKPYFNIKDGYCISAVLRFNEKSHDSLKPFPNAGNVVKLFPYESKLKPQYFGFKYYSEKKDSFIFFDYYRPCGYADSLFTTLCHGQNNIIYKINNITHEVNRYNASVDFLPNMNYLNESYDQQYEEYFVQYTYLHYNPMTKEYYRLVRLPKKKTEAIGNYKWPHGIIVMNESFKPIGFGLLPIGCDQMVITPEGLYTIDQAYTRRNAEIKLYKIEIKNTKKILEIEPYSNTNPDLVETNHIDSSKFNTYLRILGGKSINTKSIIIPLHNSCPSCIVKIGPILSELKKDSNINIIILASNKEKIDKFLKDSNLKLGLNILADYTWQYENYLPSLSNINALINNKDKVIIKQYDPDNLYDIIVDLGIISKLRKPGPQCFPIKD